MNLGTRASARTMRSLRTAVCQTVFKAPKVSLARAGLQKFLPGSLIAGLVNKARSKRAGVSLNGNRRPFALPMTD